VTPPAGAPAPNLPATVILRNGIATVTTSFAKPGYYRITATGPGNSQGWATITVGINANSPF
jgi:hypothetical protein